METKDLITEQTGNIINFEEQASFEDLLKDAQGIQFEFAKLNIPAGGATSFEIADPITGESNPRKEIKCTILAAQPTNVYFDSEYTGEVTLPACSSMDAKTGMDAEGNVHDCATCPHNQFGSAENGGKECTNRINVYLVLDDEDTPRVLSLPASAIKKLNTFRSTLFIKGLKLMQVLTSIKLEKVQSKSGITYSSPVFSLVGYSKDLPEDRQLAISKAISMLKCLNIL